MIYAQIKSGKIHNIVSIDDPSLVNDFLLDNDFIVRIDTLEPVPQIGWLYDNDVFSSPSDTLQSAILQKLTEFGLAAENQINKNYDQYMQFKIFFVYSMAIASGKTNRAAYLQAVINYANSLIEYSCQFQASVMALTDIDAVKSMMWDFSILGELPQVTLTEAVSIND